MKRLVPDDFPVPLSADFGDFVLRPLDANAAELDYVAVMESRDDLHAIFSPADKWPAADLTLEQNRKDLEWHWNLFESRTSFAWTVLTPDLSRCIGCVYFYWPLLPEYDVTVYLWAHSAECASGFDQRLEHAIKDWLARDWPFRSAAFPGRDVAWSDWTGGTIEVPEGVS